MFSRPRSKVAPVRLAQHIDRIFRLNDVYPSAFSSSTAAYMSLPCRYRGEFEPARKLVDRARTLTDEAHGYGNEAAFKFQVAVVMDSMAFSMAHSEVFKYVKDLKACLAQMHSMTGLSWLIVSLKIDNRLVMTLTDAKDYEEAFRTSPNTPSWHLNAKVVAQSYLKDRPSASLAAQGAFEALKLKCDIVPTHRQTHFLGACFMSLYLIGATLSRLPPTDPTKDQHRAEACLLRTMLARLHDYGSAGEYCLALAAKVASCRIAMAEALDEGLKTASQRWICILAAARTAVRYQPYARPLELNKMDIWDTWEGLPYVKRGRESALRMKWKLMLDAILSSKSEY